MKISESAASADGTIATIEKATAHPTGCVEQPVGDCGILRSSRFLLIGASRTGRSHVLADTPCDDAFTFRGDGDHWWFMVVADGAGSRRLARIGAKLAVIGAARVAVAAHCAELSGLQVVDIAARAARQIVIEEANERGISVAEYSSTLLLAYWTRDETGETLTTFQAGDGLVAAMSAIGEITQLQEGDTEPFAGATHFLTSEHVANTWSHRIRSHRINAPYAILLATDGFSDDLLPHDRNGPILLEELRRVEALESPHSELLTATLAYQKRGSFDDRTAAIAMRRMEG